MLINIADMQIITNQNIILINKSLGKNFLNQIKNRTRVPLNIPIVVIIKYCKILSLLILEAKTNKKKPKMKQKINKASNSKTIMNSFYNKTIET